MKVVSRSLSLDLNAAHLRSNVQQAADVSGKEFLRTFDGALISATCLLLLLDPASVQYVDDVIKRLLASIETNNSQVIDAGCYRDTRQLIFLVRFQHSFHQFIAVRKNQQVVIERITDFPTQHRKIQRAPGKTCGTAAFPFRLRPGIDDGQTTLRSLRHSLFQQLTSQISRRLQIENGDSAKFDEKRTFRCVWCG